MDGKNSSGRRISLLNDNPHPPRPARLSSTPSLRSATSSPLSTPAHSPPIPPLLMRSCSSDSTATMQTPSPITPDFAFDPLPPQAMASPASFAHSSFFPSQKDLGSAFPLVPHTLPPAPYHHPSQPPSLPLPPPPPPPLQTAYFPPPHQPVDVLPPPSANPRSKKNSYPCPVSKQYHCHDYFTTSGHAARHAKKHTGKKDAFCPECNKAFTRKDNMEQHRRTHQTGRNPPRPTEPTAKKGKQQAKRPRPAPLQSPLPVPSLSSLSMVDPALPLGPPGSNLAIMSVVPPADSFHDHVHGSPYPDPTAFAMTHNFATSSSYGLDALAIAASGEKRKYES